MKYTPENQHVPLYIDSVKEMVAYSLANDPSYDFFLKEYFNDSRVALLKGLVMAYTIWLMKRLLGRRTGIWRRKARKPSLPR